MSAYPQQPSWTVLDRRSLLRGAAAVPLAGTGAAAAGPASAHGGWPDRRLGAADARQVDPEQILPAWQLAQWYRQLDAVGLRAAGSAEHERAVDRWRDRLARAGVRDLRDEPVSFERWTARRWGLFVEGDAGRQRVPTSSYIPYSGSTTHGGAVGPIVPVDAAAPPAPGSLTGKVALFDVPAVPYRYDDFAPFRLAEYDPRDEVGADEPYVRPWAGIDPLKRLLDALVASGAVAAIGVIDLPVDGALGSYYPYDGTVRPVPGVYVDRATGARLRERAGATARVVLHARTASVTSRNVVGVIPGASDEIVLLNSHTDGSNGLEDNGPDAIVAMAQYLSRLPREALPRTVMVSLTTGHFHGAAGQRQFVAEHRDTTLPRIACALTLEHLGALEWLPRADGTRMELTGRYELGTIFTPANRAMLEMAQRVLHQADAAPAGVLRPYVPVDGSPDGHGWPGEGTHLWDTGGVMTANYITGPTYLLNARPTVRLFDADLMRRLTIAFTQAVLDLARTPRAALRGPDLE